MRLHPEIPLIAPLGLVHLAFARLLFVFGRGQRRNNRRIDDRPLAHQQPALREQSGDFVEQRFGRAVPFQPMAEMQDRRRVGHWVSAEFDRGKAALGPGCHTAHPPAPRRLARTIVAQ
jgi:hypothetical protein